jgi:hypothetical protein
MSTTNYLQAMAALRAAGSLLMASYAELARTAGPITEEQLKAAEDALLRPPAPIIPQPPQPPSVPGADTTGSTGTVTPPVSVKVEHFGLPYHTDPDPTRGDIADFTPPGGDGNITNAHLRYVDAGYNVNAFGPINRKWKTRSMYAHIFGTGRNGIWDGSNGHDAVPPQPNYSPAGWPIHYTLDGSAGRNWAGDPKGKVIGTGTLMYDDKAFSNDAEVAAYIAAQAQMEANKPAPAPSVPEMKSKYTSRAALLADAEAFAYAVKLDGATVPTLDAKFGPAVNFYSWSDGTFRQQRQQMEIPLDPQKPGDEQGEVIDL